MSLKKLPQKNTLSYRSSHATTQQKEKKLSRYTINIHKDGIRYASDIHVIDMDGWQLLECFLLTAEMVVYLGLDEGEHTPRWIDMGEEGEEQYARLLIDALEQFRGPVPEA